MSDSKKLNLTVPPELKKKRLDAFLAEFRPDDSRSRYQKLIKDGMVKINGVVCTVPRTKVSEDDAVEIEIPPMPAMDLIAEDIDLEVLYEDDVMMVINKPPNMVVHPGAGNYTGTVVNALLGRADFSCDIETSEGRPGIVHRLDKDTSGCLIVAKTPQAQFKLSRSFANREVEKTYVALVRGRPTRDTEKLVTLIGRHPVDRKKMAIVSRNGKEAVSIYERICSGKMDDGTPISMLSVRILTGRTHQIRVHLAFRKLPILGDIVYGSAKTADLAPRQMLHAWKLKIPHPDDGRMMEFEAPLPDDFEMIMARIWPDAE
jgi:23S rRNA pseudouridine1911/1915/1917 synthase